MIARNATTNMPTTGTTTEKWEKQQSTKAIVVKNENKDIKLVDTMENITFVVFPTKPEKMVIV